MIRHTCPSSTFFRTPSAVRHDCKVGAGFRAQGGDGLRGVEKSFFLGEAVEFRFNSGSGRRRSTGNPLRRIEGPRKLSVVSRALERRQSSLDKWAGEDLDPVSTRWDKVKHRFSRKQQWKPGKLGARESREEISREPEASGAGLAGESEEAQSVELERGAFSEEELQVPVYERILGEARKRVIVVRDYLKGVEVQKFLSSTAEHNGYPPLPPFTGTVVTGIGAFLVVGIILDAVMYRLGKLASMRNVKSLSEENEGESLRSRAPSALSVLLERDLRRKESVEWVNMLIGKLWNLYRKALESGLVSMLQPIIDDLEKPNYVRKVEVKSFFLGDDPVSVRTVERRTSRRADDLQYQIGVRYTGGARLLLSITLQLGIIPVSIPVGVRGLDVDSEVWVKLRMLPSDPWVGQATWAFVTLPKIKLALAPFGLVNLMTIPFLSIFLAKLLTEDLPQLFVRPNKNVVDFLQGRAVGSVSSDFKDGIMVDKGLSFSGELSVTLVEASRLSYIPYLKTDPYVIFSLGEQVRRSKRNSQTSIIGPPGAPVWNQDFKLLVVDPKVQHLSLTLHDTLGFTSYPVGASDIDLRTLQDTVPVDRKLVLRSGWGPFPKRFAGELILRLTFKAYIDEDEEEPGGELIPKSIGDVPGAVEQVQEVATFFKEEAGKVAEFFQEKEAAKEMFSSLSTISTEKDVENVLPILGFEPEGKKTVSSNAPAAANAPAVMPSQNGSVQVGGGVVAKTGGAGANSTRKDGPLFQSSKDQVIVSNQEGRQSEKFLAKVEQDQVRQVLIWLAVATGIVWVVAADLNWANLFNP